MGCKTQTFLGLLVMLVAAMPLTAQVGGPIQQAAGPLPPTELGASYQAQVGGNNPIIGGNNIVNSQLYVTGQVSGLNAFRGQVGYFAPNQLNLVPPSAAQLQFRRQSVGLPDVMGGSTATAVPYYDRSNTAFLLPAIQSGQAVPGSNQPFAVSTPESVRQLYQDVVTRYKPLVPTQGRPIESTISITPPVEVNRYYPSALGQLPSGPGLYPGAPGAGAYFGIGDQVQRQQLATELYQQAVKAGQAPDDRAAVTRQEPIDSEVKTAITTGDVQPLPPERSEATQREQAQQKLQESVGSPQQDGKPEPKERRPSERDAGAGVTAGQDRQLTLESSGGVRVGVQQTRGRMPEVPFAPSLPPPGQDVYVDMLVQLRQLRQAQQAAQEAKESPAPGGVAARPAPAVDTASGGVLLRSLAGAGADRYNDTMRRAQELLRRGRYYDAAGLYDQAVTLDRSNPLPRLGLAVSLFAAGEPYRAGFHLRKAMEIFPPTMETRLDVPHLMSDVVFQEQLAFAAKTFSQAQRPAPLLALSLAYMYQTVGETDKAQAIAVELAKLSADDNDPLMAAYANYVLTGQPPVRQAGDAPQSQPATRRSDIFDRHSDEQLGRHVGYGQTTQPAAQVPAAEELRRVRPVTTRPIPAAPKKQ